MTKNHWNTVALSGGGPTAELRRMIDHSYEQVLASLTKKERAKIVDAP